MVRRLAVDIETSVGFPHASGDGPKADHSSLPAIGFSPREWGWSGDAGQKRFWRRVFPTRVGMVRLPRELSRSSVCFPHASGDGPTVVRLEAAKPLFSPREWGWSVLRVFVSDTLDVFPTRVGMVRAMRYHIGTTNGFPHASRALKANPTNQVGLAFLFSKTNRLTVRLKYRRY